FARGVIVPSHTSGLPPKGFDKAHHDLATGAAFQRRPHLFFPLTIRPLKRRKASNQHRVRRANPTSLVLAFGSWPGATPTNVAQRFVALWVLNCRMHCTKTPPPCIALICGPDSVLIELFRALKDV